MVRSAMRASSEDARRCAPHHEGLRRYPSPSCHAPRRRGIQYAVASRFNHCGLWNTGSSAFADDDRGMCLGVLAVRCTRGLLKSLSLPTRESRECRVLAAPAVSCAMCTRKCAHEHTGTAGARRHSLRNGLTAYAELSLETNSFCLHRCRLDGGSIRLDPIRHRQLDISHGCQNHTVLPYAATSVILRAVSAHG